MEILILFTRQIKYFKKLTQNLTERGEYAKTTNINSEHFKQSHQAYFFLCKTCQVRIENIAENWILNEKQNSMMSIV